MMLWDCRRLIGTRSIAVPHELEISVHTVTRRYFF